MGKNGYYEGWEILFSDHSRPVLASRLIAEIEKGSDLTNGITRHQIAEDNQSYRCAHCRVPVFLAGSTTDGGQRLHLRHSTKSPEHKKQAEGCAFCNPNSEQRRLYNQVFQGEGEWHLRNKEKVADILSRDPRIDPDSVATERYIFSTEHDINIRRQPDIYCCDRDGNHWVFELTRWWLHPETAVARQQAYRRLGYNLVWLFSPECREKNRSTFHLLLYGSNYRDDTPAESLAGEEAQFNAFELSEAALTKSDSEGVLHLDVVYPHFVVDESLGSIDITYQQKVMSMHSLSLAPQQRLPYGVKTAVQLQQAKEHLEAARQALARQEEDQQRLRQARELKDIRHTLGTIRQSLRSESMNDDLAGLYRSLIAQCRTGSLHELTAERALRIGAVIEKAEKKVLAVVDSYLREKVAREEQCQALKEAARGFIAQFRGVPFSPGSELGTQGRILCDQLNKIRLFELASRLESVCSACHRRYIVELADEVSIALGKHDRSQWLLKTRPALAALVQYTGECGERKLQARLEKMLPIIDNHGVYVHYRQLESELAQPGTLPPGLIDEALVVYDLLVGAWFEELARKLLTSLVSRYQKQAHSDFYSLLSWDENTDYRELLPLAFQVSYDNPAAIATLLGCEEASLARLPDISSYYVGLASQIVGDFFDVLGAALTLFLATVEPGNSPLQIHRHDAVVKLLDDWSLYIASFQSMEEQVSVRAYFDDYYGEAFKTLSDILSLNMACS
ncbi:hypothetical protein [Photobacterium sp. OFAV2-7]|uniref:hypothetical protein n=1 Tax=Photobacterium sp. OFAV2-7 TaxID=2917748 RepID=UPI001EF699D5|nr:hypothetical protein [Photobacterium sp. OFAV2-7]MCG7585173.1 hypothetical protein [Photobacterium sp. OFAV2-7]